MPNNITDKPVLWRNVFGEPVDLDDIDSEYALNILMHVALRGRYEFVDARQDPLTQKLREVILAGKPKRPKDRLRAAVYNGRCILAGLPYRAGVWS